jgi:hypothetical protein
MMQTWKRPGESGRSTKCCQFHATPTSLIWCSACPDSGRWRYLGAHTILHRLGLYVQVATVTKKEGLFQEDEGFSSYGLCSLADRRKSPHTVVVTSNTLTYVVLDRESVDDLLGVRASAPPLLHSCALTTVTCPGGYLDTGAPTNALGCWIYRHEKERSKKW